MIDTKWSKDLAYVVGIFVSDGNLGKDGMYLEITSKDKIVLKQVLRIIDMEHIKIGTKQSGIGGTAYRIQFKRVLFHKWLSSLGLVPNKSLTLSGLNIPGRYFFDFLRGVWDGDGTIYCTKDKRWENSYIVSIGFASGSKEFLNWVQKSINKRLGTTGHVRNGKRVLQLRYARTDSVKIFNAMFYTDDVPHLPRKFAKAQKIFKITGLCKK